MPSQLGPVLAAVDFSVDSETALLWAAEFSAQTGTSLTIVHVAHDPADAPGYYRHGKDDLVKPLEEVAKKRFDEFLANIAADHPENAALKNAGTVLVQGIPATRILSVAEKIGAAHIVVGCQGRTGLPHLLLGSVAHHVVRHSPNPVTVVKAKTEKTKKDENLADGSEKNDVPRAI